MIARYLRLLIAAFALGANSPSYANFSMSPSGTTTAFALDAANQGTSLCAAANTECPASVPINAAGAPFFTSSAPGLVTLTGTNNINNIAGTVSLPTGASTAAKQPALGTAGSASSDVLTVQGIASMTPLLATLQASATTAIGKVDPNTIATWGLAAASQNVAAPTNGLLGLCQFTTSPPTISTTNVSPIQCNNANAVLVSVTNTNANGQGTMANSSPVAIASNQSTLAIKGADSAGSPTAGTVLAIQGIASMTKLLVTPDANSAVNVAQVNGVTVLTGTGATGTGAQRVTVSTDQATNAGAALVKGGVGVVNGGSFYQHIAASQTATVLQSSTGAAGDYLSHCVIYPSTTAAGSVTVFDNANAAATNVIEFTTGTLSNLTPIVLPVGAVSTAGAWKVTTGANETVVCYGKFS